MTIDEDRIYHLTKYCNKKGKKDIKDSDHNGMSINIKTCWKTSVEDRPERVEIYNYKNQNDFKKFQQETEDNEELRNAFQDEFEDLALAAKRWLSTLNKIIIE